MNILMLMEKSNLPMILIRLHKKSAAQRVRKLVSEGMYSEAMAACIVKGSFERAVEPHELPHVKADLILAEDRAHWDIKK